MKTKWKAGRFIGGAIVGLFLFVVGCSDGVHPGMPGADTGVTEIQDPVVNYFGVEAEGQSGAVVPAENEAASVETETEEPKPVTPPNEMMVDAGASVKLVWSVSFASRVEIVSVGSKNNFSYVTETEFESSTTVSNIQEDTTFVLTAYPLEKASETTEGGATPTAGGMILAAAGETEEEKGSESVVDAPQPKTATVKITVNPSSQLSVEFSPEGLIENTDKSYSAEAGQEVTLHWSVTPEQATVVGLSSDPVDSAELQVFDCSTGDPVIGYDSYPNEACAKVSPTVDTTYTLLVSVGEGEPQPFDVVVKVSREPKVLKFEASIDGKSSEETLRVTSFPATVKLSWKVAPADAKVTIEPLIKEATPPLPYNENSVEGSSDVVVTQDTTFTLTVNVEGEEPATETVSVEADVAALDCSTISVSTSAADTAFLGETIQVSWSLPSIAGAVIKTVEINGSASDAKANAADIVVSTAGLALSFKDAAGQERCSKIMVLPVADLKSVTEGKAVSVTADESGVYVGFDEPKFVDGKTPKEGNIFGKVIQYTPGASAMEIDFLKALGGPLDYGWVKEEIQTFPVNAVVISPEGNLLVGTTGIVVHKKADSDWSAIAFLPRTNKKGIYTGEHSTCFGKTQSGDTDDVNLGSLDQICDILPTKDGKVIFALDFGAYTFDSLADLLGGKYKGKTPKGFGEEPLYKSVVNSLVEASDGTIYAGGAKGVYKSTDGSNWSEVAGSAAIGEVYSVVVAAKREICPAIYPPPLGCGSADPLVAGTANGLYVVEGDTWSKKLDGKVYSVAVDGNTIYAGTENGFYVSRSGGANFTSVKQGVVVRGVATHSTEEGTWVYLATESGVLRALAMKQAAPVVENKVEEEQPASEETEASGTVVE